ncbi:MAG: DUF2490 domain-containing protein [Flavobacteriaceae bacterium]|nr:DUF2490 domain-containing protein [Flavobacteriaceae bacterium]
MNLRKKSVLIIVAVLFINNIFSQNNTDFSAWFAAELNYKLDKKWTFTVQEQLRLKENVSAIDTYFTQIGATYSISKNFDIAAAYRYIKENDNKGAIQGYDDFNRIQFDVIYGHRMDRFSLKYRLRYQMKNELGLSEADGDDPNNQTRFKASVGYNIRRWKLDPKISAEIFNRSGSAVNSKNDFSKYRLTFGTSYNTKKMGRFGLFYRFEKQLNRTIAQTTNIVGLKYSYTIKNKKKKK